MRDTRPQSNVTEVEIAWADCDPAGIVFYPNYFRILNVATDTFFKSTGWPLPKLVEAFKIIGYPMIDTRAKFLSSNKFGDIITIETAITRWGRSSFEVSHVARNVLGVCIEAFEKRVWAVADETGALKSAEIPSLIKAEIGVCELPWTRIHWN